MEKELWDNDTFKLRVGQGAQHLQLEFISLNPDRLITNSSSRDGSHSIHKNYFEGTGNEKGKMIKYFLSLIHIDLQKINVAILLLILCAGSLRAQDSNQNSAFISANLGGFITAHSGFEDTYNSKFGFAPGVTLGLPLSAHMYLYGKATYFAKAGVPLITTYSIDAAGNVTIIAQRKDGTAKFREWLFNAGLLYNVILAKEYKLGISAGATITSLHEQQEYHNITGELSSSTSTAVGFLGYFGGVSLERNFGNGPFSVFAEAQCNYSRPVLSSFIGNYGGTNLTLGLRFYFKDRRKQ